MHTDTLVLNDLPTKFNTRETDKHGRSTNLSKRKLQNEFNLAHFQDIVKIVRMTLMITELSSFKKV